MHAPRSLATLAVLSVLTLLAALAVLAACTSPSRDPGSPVPVNALPGFAQDDLGQLETALRRQCAQPRRLPEAWVEHCTAIFGAVNPLPANARARPDLREWLQANFRARPIIDGDARGDKAAQGLLTGYFEPLLTGSQSPDRAGQIPLMAPPDDLLIVDLAEVEPKLKGLRLRGRLDGRRVVPYTPRAGIDSASTPVGQPLVWVDDAVDAFFLEIQGSGRVQLRDGSQIRIGYADQNGQPYRAIGRTLIDRGALPADAVTGPAIKDWLRRNPAQARTVMNSNPSKVFFRSLPPLDEPDAGPPGSLGIPLTPMRSIAVDRSRIPLGSMVWIDSTDPSSGSPMQRLMLAQDTGGAIRGGPRGDFFWGFGPKAEQAAGLTKQPTRFWVLEAIRTGATGSNRP